MLIEKIKRVLRDKDERNLFLNIGMAFAVKGLSLILSFFSMPMYIRYFNNNEVLGLWYTILSTLHWINMCDLGLGNGLRNRLTEALAVGDKKRAKEYISSTYGALSVIILPVILAIIVLVQFVDLNAFFNVSAELVSPDVLCLSVCILLVGIALSFVLRTVNVVIYAIQKSSLNNALSLISTAIPLVFVAVYKGGSMEENLVALSIVHVLAGNLIMLGMTLVLFMGKWLREVAPSLKYFSVKTAKGILGYGVQFFFAQILFMLLISTDQITIAKEFSSADVVDYSIYYRLFTVVGSLLMLALSPLWSKVTRDLAQGKYRKVQITNRVLYVISALAAVAEFLMVPCMQFIVNIWLKEEAITVDYTIGLVLAFFGSVYILNVVLTTVANGMGDLRTQIVFYGIFSVLKFPVSHWLAQNGASWEAVVLFNAVALVIFCVFQVSWVERTLKKLAQKTPSESTPLTEENEINNKLINGG